MTRFIIGWLIGTLLSGLVLSILGAVGLTIFCFIIYFFLAAAGIVPPIDFVPFVPYV